MDNIMKYLSATDSFIYNIDIKSKQFTRYKTKVKDEIIKFFSDTIYETDKMNIKDVLVFYFANSISCDPESNGFLSEGIVEEDELLGPYCFGRWSDHGEEVKRAIAITGEMFFFDKLKSLVTKEAINADETIDDMFNIALLKHLTFKGVEHDIDCDNYIRQTLPLSFEDMFRIITDVINLINDFLYNFVINDAIELKVDNIHQKKSKRIKEELKKKKEDYKRLKTETASEISVLKAELEAKERELAQYRETSKAREELTDPAFKELVDANSRLKERETKIKDKYLSLLDKYNALAKSCEAEEEVKDELVFERTELNVNGHYVFIADDNRAVFVNKIKENFPNSIVTHGDINLNPNAVDFVVFITDIIAHSTYNNFKTQCRGKNIPFIHCPSQNIEIIKKTMEAHINNT